EPGRAGVQLRAPRSGALCLAPLQLPRGGPQPQLRRGWRRLPPAPVQRVASAVGATLLRNRAVQRGREPLARGSRAASAPGAGARLPQLWSPAPISVGTHEGGASAGRRVSRARATLRRSTASPLSGQAS